MKVTEKKFKIARVTEGSPAFQAGARAGDFLVSLNGKPITDVFDYRLATAVKHVKAVFETADTSAKYPLKISKEEYEDLGLEFEPALMDKVKACANKCDFCFIDQLPRGMRKTLYFKDDDYRLSFLEGNYVTLTNLKEEEAARIVKYRLSPMNISVHATDPDLRRDMMHNPNAGEVLKYIRRFVGGGITVNTQIVLCKGVNDGEALDRTLADLTALSPGMHSVSLVPVGLTAHRAGLPPLESYDADSSVAVLRIADKWRRIMKKLHGTRVVYPADEFYLMAGEKIPGFAAYEDFPQLENGVGMSSLFKHEFSAELSRLKRSMAVKTEDGYEGRVGIVTGMLAEPMLTEMASKMSKVIAEAEHKVQIDVYPIQNDFFGHGVTVAGLVTGRDIAKQVGKKATGSKVLLPQSMLRSGEETFLDDWTVSRLSDSLKCDIIPVRCDGRELVRMIAGVLKK